MNVISLNKNINNTSYKNDIRIDKLLGLLPCSPKVIVISETSLKIQIKFYIY